MIARQIQTRNGRCPTLRKLHCRNGNYTIQALWNYGYMKTFLFRFFIIIPRVTSTPCHHPGITELYDTTPCCCISKTRSNVSPVQRLQWMHENGVFWFRKTSMLPAHTGCTWSNHGFINSRYLGFINLWSNNTATFIIFVECSRRI